MKKLFKKPGKTGTKTRYSIRLLLLLLMAWGSVATYAQTIGIIEGLTPVTIRTGQPPNSGPNGTEFPIVQSSDPSLTYVNRFFKFGPNGELIDIIAVPVTVISANGLNGWFPYCTCPVSDFPQIYRCVTLNCTPGSVSPWKPDPYSNPTLAVQTNPCTASDAWSNPSTWYDYKVPTQPTGAFYINRNVKLDVDFTADNKAIYCSSNSPLTINSGVTFTMINTSGGRFINNGIMNAVGRYAEMVNNGVLSPGVNGIGQVTGGQYTQNGSGTLDIQLASPYSFDRLYWIDGTNVLGGTLKVSLLNGYVPAANTSFDVVGMSYATYTGTFSNINLPALPTGLKWKIRYNSNSVTLTVVDCSQFSATYTKSDTGCSGTAVGSIFTTPVNGTAPYMYKISSSGAYASFNPISNLRAGNYRVYTIDDNGCTTISPVIAITTHPAVTGTATASAVCHDSMGTMIVTPGSGTAPFKYRLGTSGIFGTSNTFRVKAGTSTVSLMDAYGCIGTAKASFVNPTAITASTTSTTVSPCSNSTNGSIIITPTSGASPYLYKKKVTDSYSASNSFSGLAAGTYKVYMKDANSCEIIKTVVLTPPPAVVVSFTPGDPTCTNPTGGSITLGALQSPNATFRLYPGSSVYTSQYVYTGLAAGIYYGYAKNTAGCLGRTAAIVLVPPTGCRNSFAEGKMQTANETGSNGLSVSLYPNPTKGAFTLQLNGQKTGKAEITVTSESGVLIENRSVKTTATNQLLQFNIANKAPGIYFIKVVSEQGVQTSKVVVD